ncbi:hypothetical protein [Craterilacuibacter sp. RT1T]|uniref:hypothetical protein n=1 Tax=Craterilacuibacter sp. RT1T TaxID=2942211 RepID=UPI0020BE5ED9|nr:hypothetical protein [Craterilacuibacter sp. RT1T]MCL6262267.1 hypothetical protein [Craterilacuibacter sp. RT1T]
MKPPIPDPRALIHAAEACDWARLAQLDLQLQHYLVQPNVTHERALLLALREAYGEAVAICSAHRAQLAREMALLASAREGQQAYALFSEPELL